MILKLSLELPEDKAYVAMTRKVSRAVLESLGVRALAVEDIEFIVGELAGNVIRHAGGGRFTVELEYHAERVVKVGITFPQWAE